jgi:hypothetical protein
MNSGSRRRLIVPFSILGMAILPTPVLAADKAGLAEIRRTRAASNAGIAAHDPARSVIGLLPDARVVSFTGRLHTGALAMRERFVIGFADPKFIKFVRTPGRITIGVHGDAVEHGRWVGEWRDGQLAGDYTARWRKVGGAWQTLDELYVTLTCTGPVRCKPPA